MTTASRRRFLQIGGFGAGFGIAHTRPFGNARLDAAAPDEPSDQIVRLSGDGVALTPSMLPAPQRNTFVVGVNETLHRTTRST